MSERKEDCEEGVSEHAAALDNIDLPSATVSPNNGVLNEDTTNDNQERAPDDVDMQELGAFDGKRDSPASDGAVDNDDTISTTCSPPIRTSTPKENDEDEMNDVIEENETPKKVTVDEIRTKLEIVKSVSADISDNCNVRGSNDEEYGQQIKLPILPPPEPIKWDTGFSRGNQCMQGPLENIDSRGHSNGFRTHVSVANSTGCHIPSSCAFGLPQVNGSNNMLMDVNINKNLLNAQSLKNPPHCFAKRENQNLPYTPAFTEGAPFLGRNLQDAHSMMCGQQNDARLEYVGAMNHCVGLYNRDAITAHKRPSSSPMDADSPAKKKALSQAEKKMKQTYSARIVTYLENAFQANNYPNKEEKVYHATVTGLSLQKIQVWFQNRRSKAKRLAMAEKKKKEEKEERSDVKPKLPPQETPPNPNTKPNIPTSVPQDFLQNQLLQYTNFLQNNPQRPQKLNHPPNVLYSQNMMANPNWQCMSKSSGTSFMANYGCPSPVVQNAAHAYGSQHLPYPFNFPPQHFQTWPDQQPLDNAPPQIINDNFNRKQEAIVENQGNHTVFRVDNNNNIISPPLHHGYNMGQQQMQTKFNNPSPHNSLLQDNPFPPGSHGNQPFSAPFPFGIPPPPTFPMFGPMNTQMSGPGCSFQFPPINITPDSSSVTDPDSTTTTLPSNNLTTPGVSNSNTMASTPSQNINCKLEMLTKLSHLRAQMDASPASSHASAISPIREIKPILNERVPEPTQRRVDSPSVGSTQVNEQHRVVTNACAFAQPNTTQAKNAMDN